MRKLFRIVTILFLLGTTHTFGQLILTPSSIEFKDDFHRLQNIYFINTGTDTVQVDSIYYNSTMNYKTSLYLTRFNKVGEFPLLISPGDSVLMDCILAKYNAVSELDTSDIMWVAVHSKPVKKLDIKINFYNYKLGRITGKVLDGSLPVAGADVSFFFNGNDFYRKVETLSDGSFSVSLPSGDYTIAAENPGYYTDFFDDKPSALNASVIHLGYNDSLNVNFNLTKISDADTSVNITGKIIDFLSRAPINSGIVVIRKGNHNPSKIRAGTSSDAYSAITKPDGTYKIAGISPGGYYIQSFSGYYSPSYYSSINPYESFWYKTDTLNINQSINNLDIQMPRDSSFWGGIIEGSVVSNSSGFQYSDIIIYAINDKINQDTLLYSYATVNDSGKFSIKGLPYGDYKLIGQKIGYENAVSESTYSITTSTTKVNNTIVSFNTSKIEDNNITPYSTTLFQNFPNPFNPTTTIKFFLKRSSNVIIKVNNILGQEVKTLMEGYMEAGDYRLTFDGADLSSGVYIISMITDNQVQVKKMLLLK